MYSMKVDVCIPTFNSSRTIGKCLESIQASMPHRNIIVCDGFSSDATVNIAKSYGCEILHFRGKLGGARNTLMKAAKTKWFAFVDSDVEVNKPWFYKLSRAIDVNVGATNGFALPDNLVLNSLRKPMLFTKAKLNLVQRGFTSNTLVRKKAVELVTLPDIRRCEDIILQQKIEERGWKWKIVPSFCRHLKKPSRLLVEAKKDLMTISKMPKMSLLKAATRL